MFLYFFRILCLEYDHDEKRLLPHTEGMTTSSIQPRATTPSAPTLSSRQSTTNHTIGERAALLAEQLLTAALSQQTSSEHAEAAKLGRLMEDPTGKAFTFAMVDEVFRSHDAATSARRWRTSPPAPWVGPICAADS